MEVSQNPYPQKLDVIYERPRNIWGVWDFFFLKTPSKWKKFHKKGGGGLTPKINSIPRQFHSI